MITKLLVCFVCCMPGLMSIGQQVKELDANKKAIILNVIDRIKALEQTTSSDNNTSVACVIDTRERELEYMESHIYNGVYYGDYKTDATLINSLQAMFINKKTLFFEHDSTKWFRNFVITFPSDDSLGLTKFKGTSWYLEIGRPVEGWENLSLYQNLRKGFYTDSSSILIYSREYLSIPVFVVKLDKGVVKKEAVMLVYKILYRKGKVLFLKKIVY